MREQTVTLDAARDAAWARVPHPVLVVDRAGVVRAVSALARPRA